MGKIIIKKKISIEIIIQNKLGIHCRPAALFVKTATKYESEVTVEKGDIKISGKSLMGLLSSDIVYGTKIKIIACGIDAKEAIDELQKIINDKFYLE